MPKTLYDTFGVRKILRPINKNLKNDGLSLTLKKIVNQVSRGFTINIPKNTEKVLKNDSVLLICNHPAQADVLLLLSAIPSRKKTFLIVMSGILSILPAINKYLIPVYISHRFNERSQPDWKMELLKKFHFTPEYSQEIAHKKNIKSITLATQKINEGSLVGIFPAGGSENGRDFLPGVGHIIKNLKYPEKTKIVMAHVSGTSTWDFLRILPFFSKLLPKFKIEFSQVLDASDFVGDDGRVIALNLQNTYDQWSLPFYPLPRFQYAALYLRSFLLFLLFRG
ncbi:MAG: 1-acyl-sn-glycerol-3-phosphate acyltransferase [Candidatus Shapirobacteria bacterium]